LLEPFTGFLALKNTIWNFLLDLILKTVTIRPQQKSSWNTKVLLEHNQQPTKGDY